MMLQNDPNQRPSINQILKIDFVKDRLSNLLNEDDFKDEFSHTILHNQNVFDQYRQIQQDKKKAEEQKKKDEEEKSTLESQMEGLKINLNFQPKNGVDPKVYNQIYMDYIQGLGKEEQATQPDSVAQTIPSTGHYEPPVHKQESSVSGFSYDDRNDEVTQDDSNVSNKKNY